MTERPDPIATGTVYRASGRILWQPTRDTNSMRPDTVPFETRRESIRRVLGVNPSDPAHPFVPSSERVAEAVLCVRRVLH